MLKRPLCLVLAVGTTLTVIACSSSSPTASSTPDASSGGTPDGSQTGSPDASQSGAPDASSPADAGGTDAVAPPAHDASIGPGTDGGAGDSGGGPGDAGGGGSGDASGAHAHYPADLLAQVRAAAPAYFGGTATGAKGQRIRVGGPVPMGAPDADIDVPQFEQTFFGAGPVDLYFILPSIDNTIAGLTNPSDTSACLTQAPIPYAIDMFNMDASVQMYAQCYTSGSGSLVQWGVADGGTFYLWDIGPAEWTAVIATPVDAGAPASDAATSDAAIGDAGAPSQAYAVHAWIGVGESYAWDASPGSTGVIEVLANPGGSTFEMSVAGMGFQYCGAQVVSDGVNIYVEGSLDQGVGCGAIASACVAGADGGIVSGACTVDAGFFTLPAYGRLQTIAPTVGATDGGMSVVAASQYPGDAGNNVVINGSGTGSIFFGPTSPTAGVGHHP